MLFLLDFLPEIHNLESSMRTKAR